MGAGATPWPIVGRDGELGAVFLHHAVLRGLVAVALTVRSDAPAPDPVVALWKDGLADRIAVGPLGILAEALEKQGRHVEAIRLLDRVEARGDAGELTLARAATGPRAAAAGRSEGDASGGEVPATEAWARSFESRLADSVEVARTVLGRPDATMRARVWAATAGAAALGLCGRCTEARAAADAGSEAALAHPGTGAIAESSGSEDPGPGPRSCGPG